MNRSAWPGVTWPPVRNGHCTKHGSRVEPFTKLCYACHLEQMAAAGHEPLKPEAA